MGDCGGDLGIVPWGTGQLDIDVVGHGFYPVDPFCCTCGGQLLGEGGRVAGQGYRPVLDRYADGLGVGYLQVPPQLTRDVFFDLGIGFHQDSPLDR